MERMCVSVPLSNKYFSQYLQKNGANIMKEELVKKNWNYGIDKKNKKKTNKNRKKSFTMHQSSILIYSTKFHVNDTFWKLRF